MPDSEYFKLFGPMWSLSQLLSPTVVARGSVVEDALAHCLGRPFAKSLPAVLFKAWEERRSLFFSLILLKEVKL